MIGSSEKKLLKIGQVARLTGLPAKTIRYYEERGLVEPAARTRAGYRLYGEEEVSQLEFVKRAKLLGITLEEIAELASLTAGRSQHKAVPHLKDVLEANLKETERKMAELAAFRESLLHYRELLFKHDPRESCGCRGE